MRFYDWFGIKPTEVQGKMFHNLAVESGQLESLISLAAEMHEEDLKNGKVRLQKLNPLVFKQCQSSHLPHNLQVAAKGVHILHRYHNPVLVDVNVTLGGTDSNRILVYNIHRAVDVDGALMMATDIKGKISFCTTDLAEILGYEPKKLHGVSMQKIIAQPFGQLHTTWMKTQTARVPMGSCRSGATVVMQDAQGNGVPVKCQITEREVQDKLYHVVVFQQSNFFAGVAQQRLRVKLDPARPGMVMDIHQLQSTVRNQGTGVSAYDAFFTTFENLAATCCSLQNFPL